MRPEDADTVRPEACLRVGQALFDAGAQLSSVRRRLQLAERRAEELREEVKQLRLRHEGQVLGAVSMSFGVASFPQHGATEKEVLRAADAALYRAMAAGRDPVMAVEMAG